MVAKHTPSEHLQVTEPEQLFAELRTALSSYLEDSAIDVVQRAYVFGAEAHATQRRRSGELYICHPLSVAKILADMQMDTETIAAALLHDVVEDTPVTRAQLVENFGEDVATLVDGVTKLSALSNHSHEQAQAENVQKMVLAMARDLRVIVLKLADRTHNMRTIDCLRYDKRRRIARETLDIYAPIAHRLSMNKIRHELEDIGFRTLYPMRYRILNDAASKAQGNRKEILTAIRDAVIERMQQHGLQCEVFSRKKIPHSIYHKMLKKHIRFADIFDVFGIRILTEDIDACYRALGAVHGLYQPLPGQFKDYIALPKANGYQSLHTVVLAGAYQCQIEVQIRTKSMNQMAESGVAAHWLYKSDDDSAVGSRSSAHEWLKSILEIQESAGDSLEFLEHLKVDLFPTETYVFTPQGQIIKLPRGSTVIDFAYAVHTDVGNNFLSARVDKQLVPPQTVLLNGQTVEATTHKHAHPLSQWLNYVVTAKARAAIRAYLRNIKREDAIRSGLTLLDIELQKFGMTFEQVNQDSRDNLLRSMKHASSDDLLFAIGLGDRSALIVANWLCDSDGQGMRLNIDQQVASTMMIKGTEGMVVSLAKCCHPVPGDSIVGLFQRRKGIVVHINRCKNALEARSNQTGWLDVAWDETLDEKSEFSVEILLAVKNRKGTLSEIASTISSMGCNIEHLSVDTENAQFSHNTFVVSVQNRQHLANLIRKLRRLDCVVKVKRRSS